MKFWNKTVSIVSGATFLAVGVLIAVTPAHAATVPFYFEDHEDNLELYTTTNQAWCGLQDMTGTTTPSAFSGTRAMECNNTFSLDSGVFTIDSDPLRPDATSATTSSVYAEWYHYLSSSLNDPDTSAAFRGGLCYDYSQFTCIDIIAVSEGGSITSATEGVQVSTFPEDQWVKVAVEYDYEAARLRAYVNDQLATEIIQSDPTRNFTAWRLSTTRDQWFDDFAYYDEVSFATIGNITQPSNNFQSANTQITGMNVSQDSTPATFNLAYNPTSQSQTNTNSSPSPITFDDSNWGSFTQTGGMLWTDVAAISFPIQNGVPIPSPFTMTCVSDSQYTFTGTPVADGGYSAGSFNATYYRIDGFNQNCTSWSTPDIAIGADKPSGGQNAFYYRFFQDGGRVPVKIYSGTPAVYDPQVYFNVDYFLDSSEWTDSNNRPDIMLINVSNADTTQADQVQKLILPLVDGSATTTLQATVSLPDGTYSAIAQFFNLNTQSFPIASNVTVNFTLSNGQLVNQSVIDISQAIFPDQPVQQQFESCGITNIGGCINNSFRFLFYPSTESISEFQDQYTALQSRAPFVYAYQASDTISGIYANRNGVFPSIGVTIPFGTIEFINQSMIEAVPYKDTIRTFLAALLWLFLFSSLYRKTTTLFDNQTVQ